MSFLGWRQWAVDTDGMLRPAWTPWSPYPQGLLLWRTDGPTDALCLRTAKWDRGWPVERPPGEPTHTSSGQPAAGRPDHAAGYTRVPDHARVPGHAGMPGHARMPDHAGMPGHARVPEPGCVCGLYAWRTPEQLTAAPRPRWTRLPVVLGVVRLGGRVVVAERGYRAERAYPVAVHDPRRVVSPAYAAARYRAWDAMVAEWRQPSP